MAAMTLEALGIAAAEGLPPWPIALVAGLGYGAVAYEDSPRAQVFALVMFGIVGGLAFGQETAEPLVGAAAGASARVGGAQG
jgi:hypothetical protein